MQNMIGNAGRKLMLGVVVAAGLLGAGTVAASAAPLEFHARYGAEYVPPCPGEGYFWTAGYYNGGYWVPGAWEFRGRRDFDGGYGYRRDFRRDERFDRDRHFDGRRDDRGRGFERRGNEHGFGYHDGRR